MERRQKDVKDFTGFLLTEISETLGRKTIHFPFNFQNYTELASNIIAKVRPLFEKLSKLFCEELYIERMLSKSLHFSFHQPYFKMSEATEFCFVIWENRRHALMLTDRENMEIITARTEREVIRRVLLKFYTAYQLQSMTLTERG